MAADVGVLIGIEPINRYETFLINTCDQALKLLKMIDEPNVRIHPDAYHMNIEENDFYEPTKKVAPYLCHYHLSESHRGAPGTGTVNWDEIYQAFGETSYAEWLGWNRLSTYPTPCGAATCVWRTDGILKRCVTDRRVAVFEKPGKQVLSVDRKLFEM